MTARPSKRPLDRDTQILLIRTVSLLGTLIYWDYAPARKVSEIKALRDLIDATILNRSPDSAEYKRKYTAAGLKPSEKTLGTYAADICNTCSLAEKCLHPSSSCFGCTEPIYWLPKSIIEALKVVTNKAGGGS